MGKLQGFLESQNVKFNMPVQPIKSPLKSALAVLLPSQKVKLKS